MQCYNLVRCFIWPSVSALSEWPQHVCRERRRHTAPWVQIYDRLASRSCFPEKMIIAPVNRHTLLQQWHKLSQWCYFVFFLSKSVFCFFLHESSTLCHTQSCKLLIAVVDRKIKLLMCSLCVFFSSPCFTVTYYCLGKCLQPVLMI